MAALRNLLSLALGLALLHAVPAAAQLWSGAMGVDVPTAPPSRLAAAGRAYLGLKLGRARYSVPCGSTALLCDNTAPAAELYAGRTIGNFWGVELAYLDLGRVPRSGGDVKAQGLNVSLVGHAPLTHSIGLFGKLGTTYGHTEASAPMRSGSDQGFGLSYGGGLSLGLTSRLSATFEVESSDFPFAGTGREPVRSANLGLQYRY